MTRSACDIYPAALRIAPLRRALDRSPDAIAVYTAEHPAIAALVVYVNEALTRLSGYAEEHFVGHSAMLLAGAKPDDASMASVLPPEGSDELRTAATKFRPDGSAYLVEVSVSPLYDATGAVTHYLARQRRVDDVSGVVMRPGYGFGARSRPRVLEAEGE